MCAYPCVAIDGSAYALGRQGVGIVFAFYQDELATAAIKLDPTSARAYSIRGRARLFEGNTDGALRDWAQGLRLAPTDPELYVFRAEAFSRKRRFEKVVEETAKALELDSFLAIAFRYLEGGETDESLLASTKNDSDRVGAYYVLGAKAAAEHRPLDARPWFDRAAKMPVVTGLEVELARLRLRDAS